MKNVFVVIGSLNYLASLYYKEELGEDQHQAYFDMYNGVGRALSRVARSTLDFDPNSARDY